MTVFKELSRRNVVRAGIAYLVVAWIIVQVADVVLENIGAPSWVMQTIMLVTALGFPAVLIFSWAFEVTPEGIKRESEVDRSESITRVTGRKLDRVIIGLLVIAVAYFAWESRTGSVAPDGSGPGDLSVAVLPFENRSNRDEDLFFTAGMHDDLLTTLSKIGSLKVISRTSVMEYRDTTKKIPEIAKELGVTKILEGGVQRSGNMVRINMQLIEAATDEHLWAEIYDREVTAENLFAIQTEVSRAIAEALHAALTPEDHKRIDTMPTDSLEAYDAYWRGRQLSDTRETARLEQAMEHYRRATELDPDFALAWVGLADTYYWLSSYGSYAAADTFDVRQDAIDKALAINPELGEAYASLGILQRSRDLNAEAEGSFRKAIELSPNYATAYHWYSFYLSFDPERRGEALEYGKKAVELNPHSSVIGTNLAQVYDLMGDDELAVAVIDKVLDIDPGFAYAHLVRARSLSGLGRHADAIPSARRAVELDPGSPFHHFYLVNSLLEIEAIDEARAAFADMREALPNHLALRRTNLLLQLTVGNERAARQLLQPFLRATNNRFMVEGAMFALIELRDLALAREQLDKFIDRLDDEGWREYVVQSTSEACASIWLLHATGSEDRAAELLDIAIPVIENELPDYFEHADRRGRVCYITAGDTDRALSIIERNVEQGLLISSAALNMPYLDPIRDDPRFAAVLESASAQRVAVRRELGYE